jgi:uncharacterized caspase-like protein
LLATSLPLEELRASAAKVAPVVLILLDACREDPFGAASGEGDRSAKALRQPAQVEASPGMGRVGEAKNTLFAFAAAPGATAADGSGPDSPFTTALARYLGTPGIEIRSALTLVQQEVYDTTRGQQLPYVENGLPRLYFIAEGKADLPERDRLLLAMAGLSDSLRGEVEAVATAENVPLAPLYGAVIAAGLEQLPEAERGKELHLAAQAYAETQQRLRQLAASDPEVERLRGEAEKALALGAFDTARDALDKAIKFDTSSIDELEATLQARVLSAAASLWAQAGVAQTRLDTPGAIAALDQAMELLGRIDPVRLTYDDWTIYEKIIGTLARLKELAGRTAEAEALLRTWLAMAEARFERNGDVDSERSISVALDRLGGVLIAKGDRAGAIAAYKRGLEIGDKLYAGAPDEPLYRRDLAVGLIKMGDIELAAADYAVAEASFRRAVEISAALAEDHPENLDWQRDRVSTLTRLGDVLVAQGRIDEAAEAYQSGLDLAQALHAAHPDEPEVTRDLQLSWGKMANIHYVRQKFVEMVDAASNALEIAAKLVERDPANLQWAQDKLMDLSMLGDAYAGLTKEAEAREQFGRALEIARRLVAADPSNVEWQKLLGQILNRLGTAESLDLAREPSHQHQEEAVAIYRRLSEAAPEDPQLRQALMQALAGLSFVSDDPLPLVDEALVIADDLVASGAMPAWQTNWPAMLRGLRELIVSQQGAKPAAPAPEPAPERAAGPSSGAGAHAATGSNGAASAPPRQQSGAAAPKASVRRR